MDVVSAFLFAAGALVVALTLFDALRTTIAVGGGGPLTNRLAHDLWEGALRWHRRRRREGREGDGSSHALLARMGPLILLCIVVGWIVLLSVGYLMLYSAEPGSVVSAKTGAPASFWERLYFTGFTVSTLGIGDFVPKGAPARVLTVFASLSGLFVVTLAITYLIGVISAVVAKRRLAASIAGLGMTPEEILQAGWDGKSLASLEQPLVSLAEAVEAHAQRHLAYPVLHFFHSAEPRKAVGPRVAALSEALRLMRAMPEETRPPPASTHAARSAIDGFLGTLRSSFVPRGEGLDAPARRNTGETLRNAGLPVSDASARDHAGDDSEGDTGGEEERRRHLLRALVKDDGWTWANVTGGARTSPRQAS